MCCFIVFFFLMIRRPPRSTRTDTCFPYTTLFRSARNQLLGMAAKDPDLVAVRPNGQEDTPQLQIDVDQAAAGAHGLTQADVNDIIATAWGGAYRSEEHTSELQSLMRISYAVFCLKKKKTNTTKIITSNNNEK